MVNEAPFDPTGIACVTVTFNPDMVLLRKQLDALPTASLKVLVDNASAPAIREQIEKLSADIPTIVLLRNESNLGLAAAVNRGVAAIGEDGRRPRLVLLLDQDTEPHVGAVQTLVEAFAKLEVLGNRVGALGPKLVDPATGLQHGFHCATRWRWVRIFPDEKATQPVACTNINGSGTLMPLELFRQLGGLEEEFFIDHIDTEWSFRILAAGFTLWGIPNAVFTHFMGDRGVRFWWFGWRVWPMRSPIRHFYLFRNAVRLMRRRYVFAVWKFWNVVKLSLTAMVHMTLDDQRGAQLKSMWRGVKAGFARKPR